MARARNIKPGFFKNYDLADAGPLAQLLFAGLWCLADREGRLLDRPRYIKAELFPYYDCDVNGYLTVLQRLGYVNRYVTLSGCSVIEVVNFKKHQSPHHTERQSDLPAFDESCSVSDCFKTEHEINGDLTVSSRKRNGGNPPDSLIPDSLIPDSLIPDSLIPDSLIPDSLIPDSLIPDSLIPDSRSSPNVDELTVIRKNKPKSPTKSVISDDWRPSERCYELLRDNGIGRGFADSLIGEFVLYWQERGEKRAGWDATFLSHCKRQSSTQPQPQTRQRNYVN